MESDVYVHIAGNNSDEVFSTALELFPNAKRLIAKQPVDGEAGFTVSGLTEAELKEKLKTLEICGVHVLNHIRISDY